MNISIFGLGYVGCVSLGCLARNGHKVVGVDVNPIKVNQINAGKPTIIEKEIDAIIREEHLKGSISATTDCNYAILNTELSIIAVGTPSTRYGHLNLDYIFKVAQQIGEALRQKDCNEFHIFAIRSTVLPGTVERFSEILEETSGGKRNLNFAVLSNPEFLREGSAVQDYFHPPITLIGFDHEPSAKKLSLLYCSLPAEVIMTEVRVAEIMKYVSNAFHALKISFANEIGNICSSIGIDSYSVMNIFCKDRQLNISSSYLKPGFAYGGSCLPKDLKGLQTLAHDNYLKTPLIDSIDITNELQIKRGIDLIIRQGKLKLGFLGISFKAGTDDLRNSPAVTMIEILLGKGYKILIYDKHVNISNLTGTNKHFIQHHVPHLSNLMITDINEMVAESEVLIVNNQEDDYLPMLNSSSDKVIVDMTHLDSSLRNRPNYVGINWIKSNDLWHLTENTY